MKRQPTTGPAEALGVMPALPRLGGTQYQDAEPARYSQLGGGFPLCNGIGQFIVCLGHLQVAVAKHGIAGRFRLVAGVPSFSSIPTADPSIDGCLRDTLGIPTGGAV